ncbi:M16 family metallopeptidase [Patescibacteria group bacterium]
MIIQKHTFKNGLRLINFKRENIETATIMAMSGCGSRYENNQEAGISHFLEHLVFKGTQKRPTPIKIAETIDSIGGETNAFTGKEYTGYYAKVDKDHFKIALDFVSDIYQNALLKSEDTEREKGVIIEEINLYQDTPIHYILSMAEEVLWPKTNLGRDIIGFKKSVQGLDNKKIKSYLEKFYTGPNTIVGIVSPFDLKDIQEKIWQKFKDLSPLPRGQAQYTPAESPKKTFFKLKFKETDQAHLAIAINTPSFNDQKYYTLEVINAILGANMSSRLFSRIREQLSLGYLVRSHFDSYADTGALVIQGGLKTDKIKIAIKEIIKELNKLKEKEISDAELKKGKEYLLGTLALEKEKSEEVLADFLHREFYQKNPVDFDGEEKRIKKVTKKDILEFSREFFVNHNLNGALIGPYKDSKEFETLLKF